MGKAKKTKQNVTRLSLQKFSEYDLLSHSFGSKYTQFKDSPTFVIISYKYQKNDNRTLSGRWVLKKLFNLYTAIYNYIFNKYKTLLIHTMNIYNSINPNMLYFACKLGFLKFYLR